MSTYQDVLRELNIGDIDSIFGLDKQRLKVKNELERISDPKKYIADAQAYFVARLGNYEDDVKSIYDDNKDSMTKSQIKELIDKSIKNKIDFAKKATEKTFPNAENALKILTDRTMNNYRSGLSSLLDNKKILNVSEKKPRKKRVVKAKPKTAKKKTTKKKTTKK